MPLAVAGVALIGDAAAIRAKALLGQWLMERAWDRVVAGEDEARPWPWADTGPVARLVAPDHDVDLVVLDGASGRTLAWGPGWMHGTARPGRPGLAVLGGHRDTHFAFLEAVDLGDRFSLHTSDGTEVRYRVTGTAVVDHRDARLSQQHGVSTLTLVTCWPFDAVTPNGPLRYLVHLEPAIATAGLDAGSS